MSIEYCHHKNKVWVNFKEIFISFYTASIWQTTLGMRRSEREVSRSRSLKTAHVKLKFFPCRCTDRFLQSVEQWSPKISHEISENNKKQVCRSSKCRSKFSSTYASHNSIRKSHKTLLKTFIIQPEVVSTYTYIFRLFMHAFSKWWKSEWINIYFPELTQ